MPASAQFFWNWGDRRPQHQQQQQRPSSPFNPFSNWFGGSPADNRPQQRDVPADYSRAPAPHKKPDATPSTTVIVMGDGMADWLAYGLEEAYAEKPEVAVVRKHRTTSGLIRYDGRRDVEWAGVAKDIIAAEKPSFVVMMLGINDRQSIRERPPAPSPTTPGRSGAAAAKQPPQAAPQPAPPADPELQARQSADQQNAELHDQQDAEAPPPTPAAPEPRGAASQGPFEFHTEKWEAAYIKRIDATIAALKGAGVPVFWVGLPPQRNTRASSDAAYLNDLYRQRAERAGVIFVDVWDGFLDEAGRFTSQGPDVEGQIRRLRSGDGVYFTKAGARKLAHYVEREIQRSITNRTTPMALPAPEPAAPGRGPASRPLAGPVVPLTVSSAGGGDELLGAARVGRQSAVDPTVTRVLVRGEPVAAPTGRADDFSWPRGSNSQAAVNPSDAAPTEPTASEAPETPAPAEASAPPAASAPAAAAPPRAASSGSRRQRTDGQHGEPKAQPAQRRPRPPTAGAPRPPAEIRSVFQGLFGAWR